MSQRAIRLLQAHTHAGRPFQAGALLFFDPCDAGWLVAQGIGESVGAAQVIESDLAEAEDEPLALSASTDTETDSTGDDHE